MRFGGSTRYWAENLVTRVPAISKLVIRDRQSFALALHTR